MHLSDAILIPPYAGGLLFWPVFWIVSDNRGALFWNLGKIFGWTAAGLVALTAGQWLSGVITSNPLPLINFLPAVNLISLLGSEVACFRASSGRTLAFLQRNFIAVAGIPAFSLMVMFLVGGCRSLDIAFHEGRTTATVLPSTGSGGRKSIHYSYEVDGRAYSGAGDPGDPPYPPGSTFEIRYCTLHPSFSTARNPFEPLGIICVGSAFAGVASFTASRSKKWNQTS
jgi:hypothetical protein